MPSTDRGRCAPAPAAPCTRRAGSAARRLPLLSISDTPSARLPLLSFVHAQDLGATYSILNLTFYNRAFNNCGASACNTRSVGMEIMALNASRALSGPKFTLTAGNVQSFELSGACAPTPTPSAAPTPGQCAVRYVRVQIMNSGFQMNVSAAAAAQRQLSPQSLPNLTSRARRLPAPPSSTRSRRTRRRA